MLTITATGRYAKCVSDEVITTGSVGIPAVFELNEDYGGLSPVAVFRGSGQSFDVALITNETVVPHEVLTKVGGALEVGVYARNGAGTIVIPTVWSSAGIIREGTEPSGIDPSQPTPDWTAQVQAAASEAVETANEAMEIAEAAEEAAITGAESAAASAVAAAQSATSAAGSATAAGESASSAALSARDASAAESNAADSASEANADALRAAQSAADAETAKTAAETAATAAGVSAGSAAEKAAQAAQSAQTSAQGASAAQQSAEDAQAASDAAQLAADAAGTFADDAEASKTAAALSASGAAQAKTDAETAAQAAAASAAVAQELIDQIPDIEAEIDTKAPAIMQTVGPAAVASFDDGAAGMPLKSLTVNVLFEQEGTGNPAPDNIRNITAYTSATLFQAGADTSTPTETTRAFPAEAGTIAEAAWDVLGGELSYTRGFVELDGSEDEAWDLHAELAHVFKLTVPAMAQTGVATWRLFAANQLYNASRPSGVVNVQDHGLYTSASYVLYVRFDEFDTVAQLRAWLALHPLQVVYPIQGRPLTAQLDPADVRTLAGVNNLWSDVGTVTAEYPADTKSYVDAVQTELDTLGDTVDDLSADVTALQAAQPRTVTVTGTVATITAEDNTRYVCAELATLTLTPPASGICDVVFTSGTTATVLTVPSTVRWPSWFDPTALEASTVYEINVCDGLAVVAIWET